MPGALPGLIKSRTVMPLVLFACTAALLAGCSTDDGTNNSADAGKSTDSAQAATSTAPASTAPVTTPSEDAPDESGGDLTATGDAKCEGISDKDIAEFSRDWGRVAGGVGRPDIAKYTKPLVAEVDDLVKRSSDCPGTKDAQRMNSLIQGIHRDARTSTGVDQDKINEFQTAGNAWLSALGYGESALSTG